MALTLRRAAALAALLPLVAACAGAGAAPAPAGGATALQGRVVVLAAASLAGVAEQLGGLLEDEHPQLEVVISSGASSSLAQQVLSGAPADVLATASTATMRTVVDSGDAAGEPVVVARNRLQIAVPRGNPGKVRGLAELADEDRRVALCAPQVPCGAAAARAFDGAGLTAAPDTLEQDVKAVLAKVRLGEVDAGLVYRTDVLAVPDEVEGVAFPEAERAVTDYPAVALAGAPNPAAAAAVVAALGGPEGQRLLREAGFDVGPAAG